MVRGYRSNEHRGRRAGRPCPRPGDSGPAVGEPGICSRSPPQLQRAPQSQRRQPSSNGRHAKPIRQAESGSVNHDQFWVNGCLQRRDLLFGLTDGVVLQDLANDVWKIADALNIQQTFILGQNFGNRVSRTVSSLQPDRVIGLILMAAGGEIEPSEQVWEEFRRVFDPSLSPERHLQAVANSFFAPGNDASVWTDGWFSRTAAQQTEAAKRTDFKPLYNGGTAPMLVIQGLNDKIAPPENAWKLVNRRPDARLVALPNMGHAMLPERPQQLADAVVSFLDEIDN